MDVSTGLAALQTAATYVQGLLVAAKAVKAVDQKISVLEFKEQLLEVKAKLLEAKDHTSALIQANQELKEQLRLKDEMELQEDGNILWKMEQEKKRGPYCSTCYGDSGKAISLTANGEESWYCPKCKNHFSTKKSGEALLEKHRSLQQFNRSF